eukprot:jgi/Mesvir1/21920/Mv01977-RA.3
MVMRGALMGWITDERLQCVSASVQPLPQYVKNKLAQVAVAVLALEYPCAGWPNFFLDLLGALGQGPGVGDMFCRILNALDEDVIRQAHVVQSNGLTRSMEIKDAMREQCIGRIVDAWYNLVAAYRLSLPSLAASALDGLHRYIGWVDIELVTSDRFMSLFFNLLALAPASTTSGGMDAAPGVGANGTAAVGGGVAGDLAVLADPLRIAALDCLQEIVSKRMDPAAKLHLLRRFQIIPFLAGLAPTVLARVVAASTGATGACRGGEGPWPHLDVDDSDPRIAFPHKLVALVTSVSGELLEVIRDAGGAASGGGAGLTAPAGFSTPPGVALENLHVSLALLADMFPPVLAFFLHPAHAVSHVGLEFLALFVATVKKGGLAPMGAVNPNTGLANAQPVSGVDKGDGGSSSAGHAPAVQALLAHTLTALFARMRYAQEPFAGLLEMEEPGMGAGVGGARPGVTAVRLKEYEEQQGEYRAEIAVLFRNLARTDTPLVLRCIHGWLMAILKGTPVPCSLPGLGMARENGVGPAGLHMGVMSGDVAGPSVPAVRFFDVEAVITLLYELGEVIPTAEMMPKGPAPAFPLSGAGDTAPTGASLGEMFASLLLSPVPHHGHRMVATSYMETVVRFVRLVQAAPPLLPHALRPFLDARGVHHPDAGVRGRAAYLFMRLVKAVRNQLVPFLGDVLACLQDVIAGSIVSTGAGNTAGGAQAMPAGSHGGGAGGTSASAKAAGMRDGGTGQGGAAGQRGASSLGMNMRDDDACDDSRGGGGAGGGGGGVTDESMYLFEAVGLLIGMEEVSDEQQREYLRSLLGALCSQADAAITRELQGQQQQGGGVAADSSLGGTGTCAAGTTAVLVGTVQSAAYLSRGFSAHMAVSTRPAIGQMFKEVLEVVLRALRAFPRNRVLASRATSFIHRMADCLGTAVLPFLPPLLAQLLVARPMVAPGAAGGTEDLDARSLTELLQLVNKLIAKFRAALAPVLLDAFPSIQRAVAPCFPRTLAIAGAAAPGLGQGGPLGVAGATLPGITGGGADARGGLSGLGLGGAVGFGPCNVEEVREAVEIQKLYFTFLHAVVTNGLLSVLEAESLATHVLPAVIQALFESCCRNADFAVRKLSITTFIQLINAWCTAPGAQASQAPGPDGRPLVSSEEKVPGFSRFVAEQFVPQCVFLAPVTQAPGASNNNAGGALDGRATYDLADAATASCFRESVAALVAACRCYQVPGVAAASSASGAPGGAGAAPVAITEQNALVVCLRTQVFPGLGVPAALGDHVLGALVQGAGPAAVEAALKYCVEQLRGMRQQQQQQQQQQMAAR